MSLSISSNDFKKYVLWMRQPPYDSWLPVATSDDKLDLVQLSFKYPHQLTNDNEAVVMVAAPPIPGGIGEVLSRPTPRALLKLLDQVSFIFPHEEIDERERAQLIERLKLFSAALEKPDLYVPNNYDEWGKGRNPKPPRPRPESGRTPVPPT